MEPVESRLEGRGSPKKEASPGKAQSPRSKFVRLLARALIFGLVAAAFSGFLRAARTQQVAEAKPTVTQQSSPSNPTPTEKEAPTSPAPVEQEEEVWPYELRLGDCIFLPGTPGEDPVEVGKVRRIDCSRPHEAEIVEVFEVEGAEYPGPDALAQIGQERCADGNYWFLPSEYGWHELGDRQISCVNPNS